MSDFREVENDDLDVDYSDDTCICEGCGRDVNGYDGDPCPMCCSHSYAPGSEECDWCSYERECGRLYRKAGLA